jgi:hypothetical protein
MCATRTCRSVGCGRSVGVLMCSALLLVGGLVACVIYSFETSTEVIRLNKVADAAGLQRTNLLSLFFYASTYGMPYTPALNSTQYVALLNDVVSSLIDTLPIIRAQIGKPQQTRCVLHLVNYTKQWTDAVDDFNLENNVTAYVTSTTQQNFIRSQNHVRWNELVYRHTTHAFTALPICYKFATNDRAKITQLQNEKANANTTIEILLIAFVVVSLSLAGCVYGWYTTQRLNTKRHQDQLDIFSALNHDIKNGALSIYTYADSLLETFDSMYATESHTDDARRHFRFEVTQMRHAAHHTVCCIQVLSLRHSGELCVGDAKTVNVSAMLAELAEYAPRLAFQTSSASIITKNHESGLYSIVNNMVQNALRHGHDTADVAVEFVTQSDKIACELRITNQAGSNHSKLFPMYVAYEQTHTEHNFYEHLKDVCKRADPDRTQLGQKTSTYRGMEDTLALCTILGVRMEMKVHEASVQTSLCFHRVLPVLIEQITDNSVCDVSQQGQIVIDLSETLKVKSNPAVPPTVIFIDDQAASRLSFFSCLRKLYGTFDTYNLALLDRQLVYKNGPMFYILGHVAKHCGVDFITDILLHEMQTRATPNAIIIIDQNLDTNEELILGTTIAAQMVHNPFRNHVTMVVRSANMTMNDKKFYKKAGFDKCVDKADSNQVFTENMKEWVHELQHKTI